MDFNSNRMHQSRYQGNSSQKTSQPRQEIFWKEYLDRFDFQTSLRLEAFEKANANETFQTITSTSSLRKIYDSYVDIYKDKQSRLKIDILLAKIAYQEARKILPVGFSKFLNGIYTKLNNDADKFKDFLEVFVAYHKYFNPKAS